MPEIPVLAGFGRSGRDEPDAADGYLYRGFMPEKGHNDAWLELTRIRVYDNLAPCP